MQILNFGSLNIDHVYRVDHFVRPGETMASIGYQRHVGGKGLNQSIALALAGAPTFHAGKIGHDGIFLKERLERAGVNTSRVMVSDDPTGHAIIQVSSTGENCIILFGGSNQTISDGDVDAALAEFSAGDMLLLQNEISSIPTIMKHATVKGMRVVLNPSPMTPELCRYPLELVDTFVLNEIEGAEISGETEPEHIVDRLIARFPKANIVLTLGSRGVRYGCGTERLFVAAAKVKPVDTTAAGDTFTGYYLASIAAGMPPKAALERGCKAAGICVTHAGAADSIPRREEVD